eukprot:252022_1
MAEQSNNTENKDEEVLVGGGPGGRKLATKNKIRVDVEMNCFAFMAHEFVCYVSSGSVIEVDGFYASRRKFTVDKMFDGNDKTYWASLREDQHCSVTIVFTKGAVNVKSIAVKTGVNTTYDGRIFDGKWKPFVLDEKTNESKNFSINLPCSQVRLNLKPAKGKACGVSEFEVFVD